MNLQARIILASLIVLVPIFTYMAQWGFFYLGKSVYRILVPKLKETSKLRYLLVEFKYQNEEMLFVLLGILILQCFCLFLVIIF